MFCNICYRSRPIPEELLTYARQDTHYLVYIYERMRNELLRKGNNDQNLLLSVINRSKEVALKVSEITNPDLPPPFLNVRTMSPLYFSSPLNL